MMDVAIMKTTTQTIRAVARRPMDVYRYSVLVPVVCVPTVSVLSEVVVVELVGAGRSKWILIGSLALSVIFPQTTACTANVHTVPLNDTSVQVILVWLVVVGQLPQFDVARTLYWIVGQSGATGLQLNVNSFKMKLTLLI